MKVQIQKNNKAENLFYIIRNFYRTFYERV